MKKKHMCVPVAALLLCGGAASALDVNCAPGQLSAAVGAQAATATTLAVTGAVNAADLEFVRYEMPALKSLDLSGATIASYSGAKLANGRFDSPAYTFPECALL
ncbi:MAG: hypothetical protein K2O10_07140, partial [Muribaculaceae bacterium]|nr:hypothetical protein [Muribaculaceae bacterium]